MKVMAFLLPHLRSGWAVDQAILTEEERLVVLRFGRDADDTCMSMDEVRRRTRPKSSRIVVEYFACFLKNMSLKESTAPS